MDRNAPMNFLVSKRSASVKYTSVAGVKLTLFRVYIESVFILGDFNARVGNDWQSWAIVMGKHVVGKMNTNGLMLLEFCTRFQLIITGTIFQLKNHLKITWMHARSRHWHQLDLILVNSKAMVFC